MLQETSLSASYQVESLETTRARPTVLMVTHRVPYPPDKGDRIRTFHILKHLAGQASVHLASLADEPSHPEAERMLAGMCERVEIVRIDARLRWASVVHSLARGQTASEGAFHSVRLRRILQDWSSTTRYDAALISASSLVPYVRKTALRGVPAVVDLVDVDSQKWFDYAATSRGPKRWLYSLEGRRLRRVEHEAADWARALTLVSEAEAELYRRVVRSDGPIHAITNGVDLEYYRPMPPPSGREHGCVFVGAMDYRPNVDGVCWFAREVWPAVYRRFPEQVFRIVGRNPSKEVYQLARLAGIEVVGTVPDVRPYVADAAVVVAPLRIARGIQNKVLEAMAMGKAMVASPEACMGLKCEPGRDVELANEPASWVEALARYFESPLHGLKLGSAGRKYVEQQHHWAKSLMSYAAVIG